MSDVLIRDVPDAVLTVIDAKAAKLGLSRTEFLRRRLAQEATSSRAAVTAADLRRLSDSFPDLSDPEIMAGAWD